MNILRFITVEPVLLLYMMVIFIEFQALQGLIYTKVCIELLKPENLTHCAHKLSNATDIEVEAINWNKYYSTCLTFSTFLMGLYLASWTDFFSRKITMLIPPVGSLLAAALNMVFSLYIHTHVAYFLITGFISGLSFGVVGIVASTFGYLTDIVSESSRTKRIFILEGSIFVGGTVGSYVTSEILRYANLDMFLNTYAIVFILEMAILVVVIFYIIFVIPIEPQREYESEDVVGIHRYISYVPSCSKLFSLRHIQQVYRTVFKKRYQGKRAKILLTMLAYVFHCFISVQTTSTFLFLKHPPLNFDVSEYGVYIAVQQAVQGLAFLVVFPIAFHLLHVSDHTIAIIGTVSLIAGLVMLGLSKTRDMVFICCGLFAFSMFVSPSVRSMLSKLVDEDERGKIFACAAILQNLTSFIGSFLWLSVLNWSLSTFPGLCFEIVAGLQVITVIIFLYLKLTVTPVTVYEIMRNVDGDVTETQTTRRPSDIEDPVN